MNFLKLNPTNAEIYRFSFIHEKHEKHERVFFFGVQKPVFVRHCVKFLRQLSQLLFIFKTSGRFKNKKIIRRLSLSWRENKKGGNLQQLPPFCC
jgi:hypothetical protein